MKYLFLICMLLLQKQCLSQSSFQYKEVPAKFLPTEEELRPYRQEANKLMQEAFDLTKTLPENYVTNGTVDYTKYLQEGINQHHIVVFPDFPVLISPSGLELISNSTLIFRNNSKLVVEENDRVGYRAIKIYDVQNVSVYFPVLKGERFKHKSNKGEWGMGIFIWGASNIEIINPHISNFWGDGIYIGKGEKTSNNIDIYYPVIDNNRRNGISIVSATDVYIKDPVISNTHGTNPASGVVLEPNSNQERIDNIKIDSAVTYNNDKYGIIVSIERLRGKLKKNVDIEINNPTDKYSISGFLMTGRKKGYKKKAKVEGDIIINNPSWDKGSAKLQRVDLYSPNIIIKRKDER